MLKSLFARRPSYLDVHTIEKAQSLCRSVETRVDRVGLRRHLLDLFRHLSDRTSSRTPVDILRERWHFSLTRAPSNVHDDGVFVDYGRIDDAGQIVGIYPGTIYRRSVDPLLLPSIRNQFLLARKDQWVIDGRDRGLSRSIFLSCHSRHPRYDKTWLLRNIQLHDNPLTLGHYINHFPGASLPNTTYLEWDFEFDEKDTDLYRFVPHVRFAAANDDDDDDGAAQRMMPSVVLISLRPIEKGEELFSCYLNRIEQDRVASE
jgi:hypothetical protein